MPKTLEQQRSYWREQRAIYRKLYPERVKEQKKRSELKNREASLSRKRKWQELNRDKCRASNRKHYQKNRESILSKQKRYEYDNRLKINARRRQQRETDIQYRLKKNISRKIHLALTRQFCSKNNSTIILIGCDISFLKGFLEARFKDGMSWENYGKWHIDHKIPCAEFDLSNVDQQKQCFHYSNLQPLWGIDNLRKGSKHPGIHQAELL